MTQTTALSNTERKSSASSGCGCGDVCHCGQSADATCGCQEGLLVQPHFFAGQLLTDEDLQALTNYVLTKHRLHNRYITGSGVACGLAVTCHPCDPGKVIVQPGYAVDCCGNDIHVPCPVELDINAMVRDLKFKLLGRDCGDPCAPNNNGKKKKKDPCADHAERYCLYINYCEQPTDLVTPYVQDDSCTAGCQPTRLREGFQFELRCFDDEECPLGILERLRCCLGDAKETEHIAGETKRVRSFWRNAPVAIKAFEAQEYKALNDAELSEVEKSYAELTKLRPRLLKVEIEKAPHKQAQTPKPGEPISNPDGEEPCPNPEPAPPTSAALDEREIRAALDHVHTLGAGLVRQKQAPLADKERKAIVLVDAIDEDQLQPRQLLVEVTPKIGELAKKTLKSPVELQAAEAIISGTNKYIDPELDQQAFYAKEAYLYVHKAPASKEFTQVGHNTLARIKDLLLRQMRKCPPSTKCCLMEEVCAIVVPTGDDLNEQSIAALEALFRAFMRYLLDCFCAALIPPCPTCEDPAVKLACLEVKDCKVDNICNLERTFLLTENNFRHWLPFLCSIGEFFERLCCDCPRVFDRSSPRQNDVPVVHGTFRDLGSEKAFDEMSGPFPDMLAFVGVSKEAAKPAFDLGNHLRGMLQPFMDCVLGKESRKDRPGIEGVLIDTRAPTARSAEHAGTIEEKLDSVMGKINAFEATIGELQKENQELKKRLTTSKKGPKK